MDASDAVAVSYELSSLDDYTLLELLDRMPLGSLLRLGRVSRRFKQLVEWNCLHRRRQLGIVIGYCYVNSQEFQFNSITVAQLDRLSVESILKLLPNITMFEIVNNINSSDILDEMLYLLEGWADQLVVLKLWITPYKFKPRLTTTTILPLFGLINRMRQLKRLALEYHSEIAHSNWTTLHLPIIGHLEKLTFKNIRNDAEPLMRQLLAHGTHQLTQVNLWCRFDNLESSTLLLNAEPHLARSFTQLYLSSLEISFHLLVTVCQKYQSLRKLHVPLHLLTIGQLNRALTMLPQLTIVNLSARFPTRSADRHHPEEMAAILGEELEPDPVESSQLVPLPGVTTLNVSFTFASHSDWDMLHLAVLFPNLANLSFHYMACVTCKYSYSDGDLNVVRRCLQQLQSQATFGEIFPKLCQVKFSGATLSKEYWQPNPPTGQVISKTASKCRLVVAAKKAFKMVRRRLSMSNILSTIGLAHK